MILHNNEIERLSSGGLDLIAPYKTENLRASSYDLTVGDEYYIGQTDASYSFETQSLGPYKSITIPPHAVCFILSTEQIHLPPDITARVSLRMSHIYAGLVLTSQPPFDPKYNGKVVVMLHNLSSASYHLKRGDRIATIEFTKLLAATTHSRVHRSVTTLEEQLTKPLVSSLSEIANTAKSTQDKVVWLSSQMLIFAALVVAVLAVPGFFSYSNLFDRLSEQREQIKGMDKSLKGYQEKLDSSNAATVELKKQLAALEARSDKAKNISSLPPPTIGRK